MKNWKTTLAGLGFAIANVAIPMIQSGSVSGKDIAVSCFGAALGYFSKDHDVTGTEK